jgi:putative ABC transport system ATP-binding protein
MISLSQRRRFLVSQEKEIVVKLEDVCKDYPLGDTTVQALQGISFEILKGDFISIAGSSGSGKTTALNLIGCVDVATSGEVTVLGQRTDQLDDEALTNLRHKSVGFIFQTFNLIPVLNIRENIQLPQLLDSKAGSMSKKEQEEWVDHLIESVGLADRATHKPNELSGGQRQRVAIARSLVMRPPIVLADEPTANLDSTTGESILALMKRMNREFGTTFIFSTHDPSIVNIADHVIRLKDGRVIENRRADEKALT